MLPDSWIETTLANIIIDLQPGFAQKPGEEDDGSIPQMRTHNVSPEGKITLDGIKFVTPSEHELEKYSLKKGDILFNNTNSEEWVGKTAVFDQEGSYVFSNHMTRIRANTDIVDPVFLSAYLHLLWSIGFSKNRAKRWVNQAAIEGKSLSIFKIPLPTLPEQQRIVSILKEVVTLSQRTNKINKAWSEFLPTLFLTMFCNPGLNEKGYPQKNLADLGACIGGGTPSREKESFWGGDIPWVSPKDMKDFFIGSAEEFITREAVGGSATNVIPGGSVLVVTRSSILKKEFPVCWTTNDVAINQDLKAFVPTEEIDGLLLAAQLKVMEPYFLSQVRQGATVHNLETDRLLKAKIIVPDRPEQEEFNRVYLTARNIYEMANARLRIIEQLHDLLLSQAFLGDLTYNWRLKNEKEIEKAVRSRNAALAATKGRQFRSAVKIVTETKSEISVVEKKTRRARNALLKELSNLQRSVRNALQNWKGVLIPDDTAVLDQFCNQLSNENEGNIQDRVLRALDQLAALGLIAKISLPNEQGRYLTCFRMLREGEARRTSDIQAVNATIKTA